MPIALLLAVAASLGIHVAALFSMEFDLSTEPESLPIIAELKPELLPPPAPLPRLQPERKPEEPVAPKRRTLQPRAKSAAPTIPSTPVMSAPEDLPATEASSIGEIAIASTPESVPAAPPDQPLSPPPAVEQASARPRLPANGTIQYRVDRGDSNFEIGVARHAWEIVDGHYRLTSLVETTGLAWLLKSVRLEMESRGQLTAEGLQPDFFVTRRNGLETREKAFFDWEIMKIRLGNRPEQALVPGAQDLLSFNYQLGFLPHLQDGTVLPVTTGKKLGIYRLEVLGDEEIDIPSGVLRTLHLRASGETTTELWLAYDYLLLPVKIRYVDKDGDIYVQVATEIQLSSK